MGITLDDLSHLPKLRAKYTDKKPYEIAEISLIDDDRMVDSNKDIAVYVAGVVKEGDSGFLVYSKERKHGAKKISPGLRYLEGIRSYKSLKKLD